MDSRVRDRILGLIETQAQSRVSLAEFQMAYQARVVIDRIRFANRNTEQFAPHTDPMREIGLQLLDALQRLESVERHFEERSRFAYCTNETPGFCECESTDHRIGISSRND